MMLQPASIDIVRAILTPESFYDQRNSIIAGAIFHLQEKGLTIDLIGIGIRLQDTGHFKRAGGPEYLAELLNGSYSTSLAEHYAERVREMARRRALIQVGFEIADQAHDGLRSVDQIRDSAESALRDAVPEEGRKLELIGDLLPEAFSNMAEKWTRKRGVEIPSGIGELDELTAGLQRGELLTVAARPSVGKSSFGLGIALSCARAGRGAAFFSLEMSRESLIARMLSALSHVDGQKMTSGFISEFDMGRLVEVQPGLSEAPIWIDDTQGRFVYEIRSAFRALKTREPGLDVLIVDYLQNIRRHGPDREIRHEIGEMLIALRNMAKELNVAVVVLSQLRRPENARMKDRPNLFELKESSRIEEVSDTVVLLHRPTMLDGGDEAEMIVAKQRNGPTGIVRCRFLKRESRFVESSVVPPAG